MTQETDSSHLDQAVAWEAPAPHQRVMGLLFERDITPTTELAAGFVRIPPGGEQPRLSRHPGEEVYFVVRGQGRFDRGDRSSDVDTRGAVYVRPFEPHRWINIGGDELEVFWVNSPSAFGPVGGYRVTVDGWRQVQGPDAAGDE